MLQGSFNSLIICRRNYVKRLKTVDAVDRKPRRNFWYLRGTLQIVGYFLIYTLTLRIEILNIFPRKKMLQGSFNSLIICRRNFVKRLKTVDAVDRKPRRIFVPISV